MRATILFSIIIAILLVGIVFPQDIPVSSVSSFNEKGFPDNPNSISKGNEIINDYDGNLMLYYNQRSELFNGEMTELSLYYNSNVEHRIFLSGYAFNSDNGFICNSPEWIVGYAGFAIQTFNFETNFKTLHQNGQNTGTFENSEIGMLIPGYHYCNKLSYDAFIEENGTPYNGFDYINILRADGTKLTLFNDQFNQRIGNYFEEGKDSKGIAKVSYIPNTNNLLRKVYFLPGDGNTYYFEEEWSQLNGAEQISYNDPKTIYLKEIYSTLGDTVKFTYLNNFETVYPISNGRKIFHKAVINKSFNHIEDIDNHNVISLAYDMFNFSEIDKLFRVHLNTSTGNSLILTLNLNDQTDLTSTDRDPSKQRIAKVISIADGVNSTDFLSYTTQNREYLVPSYSISAKVNSPLLSSITYATGGKSIFEYHGKTFDEQPPLPFNVLYNLSQFNTSNMNLAFRDCYTNYMIKKIFRYDNSKLISRDEYSYDFNRASNGNQAPLYLMNNAPIIYDISTTKSTYNQISSDLSAPQNVVNIKIYNQYRTGWFSYINLDHSKSIKLMQDTKKTITNPQNTDYVKTSFTYEIGELINSGSKLCYNGNFHQKTVIEQTSNSNIYKERLLSSTTYTEIQYVPSATSTYRIVPKTIETVDENGLLVINKLKNYIPDLTFPEIDFYKIGLEEENVIKYNGQTKNHLQNIYYEGSENSVDNPNGIMIGHLKQKTVNFHSRGTSEIYKYFTPTQSARYKGYLKSIEYGNGAKQYLYYPDRTDLTDPLKPHAFDSVYVYKINYDGTKVYELFKTKNQQLKPFKSVLKYNNSNDSLVQYTSFDSRDNLLFEVDANRIYSEYKYDNIGRLKSATFPGSFSDLDSTLTHTYTANIIDTLNYGFHKGSYRTVSSDGQTYNDLEIVKTTEMQSTDYGTEWAIESDSKEGGESDGPIDTTHTKLPRICYVFFERPIITSTMDSLISVEFNFATANEYLPDPSESRTIYVKGIKSDSTVFGNQISFTFIQNHIYSSNEINIKSIIEQFKSYGYSMIGLRFDSPYLTGGNYEYNYKEFKFFDNDSYPFLSINYLKTIVDTLTPEGSVFAYYNDNNRSVNSIRRFSNAPDKLTNVQETTQYYEADGKLVSTLQKNNIGNFIQKQKTEYNFLQAPKKIEDGETRQIFTKYDYLSRPVQLKTDEDWTTGPSKKIDYFLSSENEYYNIEQMTDENNKVSKKYFDKVGILKKEERVDGELMLTNLYSYDDFYRLTSVTSPAGKITSYLYDDHSNISQKTSPDEGTTKFKYDKYGNLRFSINTASATKLTFNKYDNFNRLILTGEKSYTNPWNDLDPDLDYSTNQGSISAFENYSTSKDNFVLVNMYDKYIRTGVFTYLPQAFADSLTNPKGKLVATAFRDKTSPTTWSYKVYSYDHLGRVKDEYVFFQSTSAYKKITNEYDNLGNLIKQNIDNQFYTWYGYDEQARLKEVRSNMHNAYTTAKLEAVYSYDQSDKVLSAKYGTYGNYAPKVLYTYDGKGRVSNINGIALDVFTTVFQQTLTYYDNDNIHTMFLRNDGNGSWPNLNFTYSYDNYNRLTSAACSNSYYTETYSYDYDGNLTHKTRPYNTSQSLQYYYEADGVTNNYLTRLTKGGTNYSFTYDYKGNMIFDQRKATFDFVYDRRNLPIQFLKAGLPHYYLYNDGGQRIYKQTSSSNKEYYLIDHTGKELAIYNWVTGKLKMLNLFGNGIFGKVNVSYNAQNVRTDSRQYYIKDYLGSIRMTIDEKTFEVISAQDYFPFGGIMENRSYTTGGNINDKYKFTEKERDTETNYDYFGARYYDSELGIWRSVDPLSSQRPGLTPYNYCQNNPLVLIDPTGMLDTRLEFDEDGNYVGAVEDGKNEITGAIVNKNREVKKTFRFNSTLDASSIFLGKSNPDGLNFNGINANFVNSMDGLIDLGICLSKFSNSNIQYAAEQSGKGGLMDFVQYLAVENSNKLLLIDGIAYNAYDAGNFMWGAAMNKLGIPYLITRIGAEVNAIVNSSRDNNKGIGLSLKDDSADIMAYSRGFYRGKK